MARYTGPKTKIARKFGEPIFGPDKVLSKKNYPPGQHGVNKRRKTSEYGIQLRNKKPNILTAYSKDNSVSSLRKLRVPKVLRVSYCCNSSKPVSTMSYIAWV